MKGQEATTMTGKGKHADSHGRDAAAGRKPGNSENSGEERRTVDEDAPTPEGLTSPGQGADDAPSEPRQSKDYA
jgi:hypothetical protein